MPPADVDDAKSRAAELRERINAAGLTLAEFGRRAGFTRNVMYGLAKGRTPSPQQQMKITQALAVSPSETSDRKT